MKANYPKFSLPLLYLLIVTFFSGYSQQSFFDEEKGQGPTLVELLKNGESYSIEITSVGCFNGSRQTLTLSKEADIVSARLKGNAKQLSEADIQKFIDFELELRALQIGGCTTIDTYVLTYQGKSFQTSDGTCSWHGYRPILNIFG